MDFHNPWFSSLFPLYLCSLGSSDYALLPPTVSQGSSLLLYIHFLACDTHSYAIYNQVILKFIIQ